MVSDSSANKVQPVGLTVSWPEWHGETMFYLGVLIKEGLLAFRHRRSHQAPSYHGVG